MKYIDAKKLKVKIIELRSESCISEEDDYYEFAKADVLDIIDSLQQEQQEVSKGKFVFPKFLYARTKDNKTIDISYAPQNIYATEYIRNDFVKQELSDTEEAAKELYPDFSNDIASKAAVEAVRNAFKAGVQWVIDRF